MDGFKLKLIKRVASCALIGLVGVGMSGCGGASVSPMQQDKLQTFGIADIKKNIQDVKDAKNVAKLDFYSPKNLIEAETHAYKALSMHKDEDDKADIYKEVELSRNYLAKGYSSKSIIEKELKDILVYKQKLDALHAKELFNDEYSDIEESITDMISDIEDGEGRESFKDREQTLNDSKILYSKMKVSSNLHSVEEVLNTIDKEVASQSYEKAMATYVNAKFTIDKFPDDEKITKEKTQEALDEALYAQTIERESKKLMDLEENVELFVIDEHEKLIGIYTSIYKNDHKFRTLTYSSKTSKLRSGVVKMIEEKKLLQDEISILKSNIEKMTEESVALENENKILTTDAKVSRKSMADLDEKFELQKLKAKSLETKMQNSNEQLLKSKDGALDVHTKLSESQKEIALLKLNIEEEKKLNQDKDIVLLDSEETINKLNKKINSANSKLKKELRNSSKLSDALEDKDIVIKSLKSENKSLKAKSTKTVVKEVVKEVSPE